MFIFLPFSKIKAVGNARSWFLRCSRVEGMAMERKQKIETMGKERLSFVQITGSQWQKKKKKYKRQLSCWQFCGKSFERFVPLCNLDGRPCVLKPAELNGHIPHMSTTAVSFAGEWTVIRWCWIWMGCYKVAASKENKTSSRNQG